MHDHACMYIKNIHAFTVYSIYIYPTPSWALYNYTCLILQLSKSFFFCKGGSCFFPWRVTSLAIASCTMNPWIWRLLLERSHANKATVVSLMPGIILICVPGKRFLFRLGYLYQAGGMLLWDFCRYKYYIGYRRIAPFTKVFPCAPCRSLKSTRWFQRCHFHPSWFLVFQLSSTVPN